MLVETVTALVGLSIYSWFIEPHCYQIRCKRVELHCGKIRPLTILHLSDFHFNKPCKLKKRFLKRLAETSVDFIFITGDLIDRDEGIGPCLEALQPFSARFGMFAVLGNHDYIHLSKKDLFRRTGTLPKNIDKRLNDVFLLKVSLNELGFTVLQNQRQIVNVDGIPFTIAGVDDPYIQRDDLPATFQDYRKNGPLFVLVHSQERHLALTEYHPDMVFSGHTHGGQVCLPFWGPIITRTNAPRCFAAGLTRWNGTLFYTTRGVGSGRIARPRFWCPPEAVFFEIQFTGTSCKNREDGDF